MEKKLEQLKKDYSEFIDIAAHDLDAPLRKLAILVERLTEKFQSSDEDVQPYISRIHTSVAEMRAIIDSLSDLSRLSNAKLQEDSCSTEDIICDIVKDIEQKIKPRTIKVDASDLPTLRGDCNQLRQLFKNLIDNSVRFNNNDPVEIKFSSREPTEDEIEIHELEDGINFTAITMKDNGIGFRQEYAERIFRPFVRLHGKSEYPGQGLGLGICRKIAENHNGAIYADSIENDGARFVLILPQTIN